MLLSARPLRDVADVNHFRVADEWQMTEGDSMPLYFQLVDKSLDIAEEGFKPPFRRYAPAPGATVQITFESIDMAKQIIRYAVQPFTQDPSIWKIILLPTDPLRGTVQMRIKLTEGSVVSYGLVQPALAIENGEDN